MALRSMAWCLLFFFFFFFSFSYFLNNLDGTSVLYHAWKCNKKGRYMA